MALAPVMSITSRGLRPRTPSPPGSLAFARSASTRFARSYRPDDRRSPSISLASDDSPGTRAVTAGRSQQGSSLTPPLWGTSVWQTAGLDDTRASGRRPRAPTASTAATPTRPCGRSRKPSPSWRTPRTPSPSRPAWGRSPRSSSDCAPPAITSSPSARSTPGRRRSSRVRALGSVSIVSWSTAPNRCFAAAVVLAKTMLVIAESPSNPRLDLVDLDDARGDHRAVHARRLDVRHASRPTARQPWRRPRPALGNQGDLWPQRRHPRCRRR